MIEPTLPPLELPSSQIHIPRAASGLCLDSWPARCFFLWPPSPEPPEVASAEVAAPSANTATVKSGIQRRRRFPFSRRPHPLRASNIRRLTVAEIPPPRA